MNIALSARRPARHDADEPVDPRMETALRYAVAIGATLLLVIPGAAGSHALLGWLPLWLLGMPLAAWWALHRFRLPRPVGVAVPVTARRAMRAPQARRRARPAVRALPRAA